MSETKVKDLKKNKTLDLITQDEKSLSDGGHNIEESIDIEVRKKKAKPILKRYKRAKDAIDGRNDELKLNMAIYESKQKDLPQFQSERPWAVQQNTPYCKVAIDTRTSSLAAEDYKGELFPFKSDDVEAVKSLENIIHDEWSRMSMNKEIKTAVKNSAILREGYIHFYWETDKVSQMFSDGRTGYIAIDQIHDPSTVYIDPMANGLREAQYVSIPTKLSIGQAREMYPEFYKKVQKGQGDFTDAETGDISENSLSSFKREGYTLLTHYEKSEGKIFKMEVLENILVSIKELNGHKEFPIAQMRWQKEHSTPYGLSLMDDIKYLQIAINAIESAMTQTAVAYSSPSYAIRNGSGINPKLFSIMIGAPGFVTTVNGDPKNAFAPLQVPKLDASIIQTKGEYISEIDRIAGINSAYLGSIGTAGNTAQGTEMAIERAKIIEADVLQNISEFVEQCTIIMAEFISTQYGNKRLTTRKVNIAEGTTKFEDVELDKNIKDVMFSFEVKLDAKTSYSVEREKQLLKELWMEQNQYEDAVKVVNQVDIIERYDVRNKQELIDRYNLMTADALSQKANLILEINKQVEMLGIDNQELVDNVNLEILSDDKTMNAFKQLQQLMQQAAAEFDAQKEADAEEIIQTAMDQGIDPMEMVDEITGGGEMPPM